MVLTGSLLPLPPEILGYPQATTPEIERRRSHLKQWGIEAMVAVGTKNLGTLPILGLGYVGVVVMVLWRGQPCALKIRRLDSNHNSLWPEIDCLAKANQIGIGPRLLKGAADFLLMEFVAGRSLLAWLQAHQGQAHQTLRRTVMQNILSQAFALDQVGLDRGDMGRLTQDVIVNAQCQPVLLDFSGASLNRRPQNLTSALQGLLWGSALADYFAPDFPANQRQRLMPHLRLYKQKPHSEQFQAIMAALGCKQQ
ncbi:hypothetical protein [Picosynechococcus sp. PCC 8807]|uniref:hypothetical protein n=1 Tax=Picosynechococcus sp. PCC 8807 TaxID=195248 RepID=UPI0008107B19|nr:hypothetical protein [Picosynechococcus sp. PCC 8807]ANV91524.1 hypothetical protein AWQ24_13285 [Picosynechococcus sp. PCC 8807]